MQIIFIHLQIAHNSHGCGTVQYLQTKVLSKKRNEEKQCKKWNNQLKKQSTFLLDKLPYKLDRPLSVLLKWAHFISRALKRLRLWLLGLEKCKLVEFQ